MDSPNTEFLREIQSCQGILHQICRVYEKEPETRKDLFQEILYQLWKSYPNFRGQSKFSTWLYRVALNTAITHYGKTGKLSQREIRMDIFPESEDISDDHRERINELYKAINMLGKIDKALILLFLEDKSYEEIADIMGMTTSNVGVRLLRAKKKLEVTMKEMTQEN